MTAHRAPLPNGRWHLQHGPIDLVIGAEGHPGAVAAAHAAAWTRFETVLAELVGELSLLRSPISQEGAVDTAPDARCPLRGPIAHRMWLACAPFAAGFITPMAAVAGAVADEIARAYDCPGVARAWVDNGGDIALVLAPGQAVTVGLVTDPRPSATGALDGRFVVAADGPIRGIATSGWRGRSFSRGIADSVTVLAATAAAADAAATMIANAVDLPGDRRIVRAPANTLKDDTDLGALEVTVDVPPLDAPSIEAALAAGAAEARRWQREGLVEAVALVCQHRVRLVAPSPDIPRCRGESASGSVFA